MVNNPVEHAILPWLPLKFKAGGPLINATSLGINGNNPTRNIFYWWSLNGEVSSSLIISHRGTRQWNLYWKSPHVRNTLHLVRRSTAMKIYSLLWITATRGRPGLTHRLSTSQWLCVKCLWCSHLLVASSCQLLRDSSPLTEVLGHYRVLLQLPSVSQGGVTGVSLYWTHPDTLLPWSHGSQVFF